MNSVPMKEAQNTLQHNSKPNIEPEKAKRTHIVRIASTDTAQNFHTFKRSKSPIPKSRGVRIDTQNYLGATIIIEVDCENQ